MSLEAALDDGKEAVAVRFLKERFHTLIELLKKGRRAPALHIAELRDNPHFAPPLLEADDGVPLGCQLPAPSQPLFAQPSVFGIREELVDNLLPFGIEGCAVVCGASGCRHGFASPEEQSAGAEVAVPLPSSALALPAHGLLRCPLSLHARRSYRRSTREGLPELARHTGLRNTPWRSGLSELFPDGLGIELEDGADRGEGEAVVSVRQHPLPGLVPGASAGSAAPVASADLQILESILKDGQAQAAQPAVCRRVDDLHGQDNVGGK
jgi:hypothetical protein